LALFFYVLPIFFNYSDNREILYNFFC
jgi:hypothetical protein